ncbi:hypothetical protein HYALB_00008427 [Hymenoscyphus albidus]|uniref:Uncharacterized protein n=1 Tax=Hymenoscyphus albidus TaxID=595503 RepID=A0A9N9Q6B4_9HELO|nr:hypothetical protein HYALB_00008427 [Hymenoscyphus albidus]
MRASRFLLPDVIRDQCLVHQRAGRKWYTSDHRSNTTDTPTETYPPLHPTTPTVPSANKVEPVNLHRLVTDLDAVDSPYVIPYAVAVTRDSLLWYQKKHDKIKRVDKEERRERREGDLGATHPEVLAYALLGNSNDSAILQSHFMGAFLRAQRPQTGATEQDRINELALNIPLDSSDKQLSQEELSTNSSKNQLERQLLQCTNTLERRRVVDILSSTREGCHILNQHLARTLIPSAQGSAKWRPTSKSSECLLLLNDVYNNIISRGITPSRNLINAALYYASKCGSLPAIRQYLPLADIRSWLFGRAMRHLQLHFVRSKRSAPAVRVFPWLENEAHMNEIFELLTGWEYGRLPESDEPRKLSFALLLSRYSRFYCYYILGLGEAGLPDILELESKIAEQKFNILAKSLLSSQVFAMAHLLADRTRHAGTILSVIPAEIKSVDLTTAKYQDEAQLRYAASNKLLLSEVPAIIRDVVRQHYDFHGLRPGKGVLMHIEKTICRVQHYLMIDPAVALKELHSILILGFSAKDKYGRLKVSISSIPDRESTPAPSPSEPQESESEPVPESEPDIGLSDEMCELLKIEKWSKVESRRSKEESNFGLVVWPPDDGPPLYEKRFSDSDGIREGNCEDIAYSD